MALSGIATTRFTSQRTAEEQVCTCVNECKPPFHMLLLNFTLTNMGHLCVNYYLMYYVLLSQNNYLLMNYFQLTTTIQGLYYVSITCPEILALQVLFLFQKKNY